MGLLNAIPYRVLLLQHIQAGGRVDCEQLAASFHSGCLNGINLYVPSRVDRIHDICAKNVSHALAQQAELL